MSFKGIKKTKFEKLNTIKADILKNLNCPLKDNATNIVFGEVNPNADLVFIGEAPGKDEDLQGRPFVGRAGKELEKLLDLLNLTREDIYICNILKYRPPKNRDPNLEEIKRHTPYLIEQIKIIKPKIIITLGNFSTKFILSKCITSDMKKVEGISMLHGIPKQITIDNQSLTIVPMYHPAAMLYNPKLRNVVYSDYKKVKKLLN